MVTHRFSNRTAVFSLPARECRNEELFISSATLHSLPPVPPHEYPADISGFRMGNNLHFSAADSGDHRFGIGGLPLRLQYRFVKTGEDNIQLLRHFIGAVRLSGLILILASIPVQQPWHR